MLWIIFYMLICHLYIFFFFFFLYIFFSEIPVKIFGPFLFSVFIFLLFSFQSCLYILDNILLSDVSFANIFSQFVTCLLS